MSQIARVRETYMRDLNRLGLRLDDAAAAAEYFIRVSRKDRDENIHRARETGFSIRQIAKQFHLTKSQVQRILSPKSDAQGTASSSTLSSAA